MQSSCITSEANPSSATTGESSPQAGSHTCITAMSMVVSRTLAESRPWELTRESLAAAVADHTYSIEEIARRFHTTDRTIRKRCAQWGIPRRGQRVRCPQKDEITRERLEPLWQEPSESIEKISRHFRVSSHTVKRIAAQLGLGPKPGRIEGPLLGSPVAFTKERLTDLWTDHTPAEISAILNCSLKTVQKWARRWGMPSKAKPDPTEEEIYAMAAELRKSWPPHRFL